MSKWDLLTTSRVKTPIPGSNETPASNSLDFAPRVSRMVRYSNIAVSDFAVSVFSKRCWIRRLSAYLCQINFCRLCCEIVWWVVCVTDNIHCGHKVQPLFSNWCYSPKQQTWCHHGTVAWTSCHSYWKEINTAIHNSYILIA